MPEGFTYSIDRDGSASKKIDELSARYDRTLLYRGILKLFDRLALKAAGFISKNMLSGQLLDRRSGALAREVTGRADLIYGIPSVRVGVFRGQSLRYAGIQEQGTKDKNAQSPYDIIRPVHAKALAIPLAPVLTPAGVARIKGPRDYERAFGHDLKFIPFHKGTAIGALYDEVALAKAQAKAAKSHEKLSLRGVQAAYLLLSQVSIEPKHYLYTGMLAYLPQISVELKLYLDDVLSGRRAVGT